MQAERSLDPTERRIVGVLIEKELTTPAQYPLSLNALVTGCNQKNNRDPVSAYAEFEIEGAFRSLYVKGWVAHATGLGRVVKHQHRVEEQLGLNVPERAVLAELLLRGPQQPGELRARSARMAPTIDSVSRLMEVLESLRSQGLVTCLGRRSGERADRWGHTLCSEDSALADPAAEAVGVRETVAATPVAETPEQPAPAAPPSPSVSWTEDDLRRRVAELEARVAALERSLTNGGPARDP